MRLSFNFYGCFCSTDDAAPSWLLEAVIEGKPPDLYFELQQGLDAGPYFGSTIRFSILGINPKAGSFTILGSVLSSNRQWSST